MEKAKIWLVGAGGIGYEYARVLSSLKQDYVVIGRGEASAQALETKMGEQGYPLPAPVVRGGLTAFLQRAPQLPEAVIVALPIDGLQAAALELMAYGVKKILLEKPGFGTFAELDALVAAAREHQATVLLAYNRRFYSSVLKAEEIIAADGGVTSFNFEFTEWTHTINPNNYAAVAAAHWLLGNSSHVIDTAFFLGGQPTQISCYRAGEGNLPWHPAASIFAGAGVSDRGALFSYQAAWQSPGRWVVEVLTHKHRLYFKPMESLQIQELGSVAVNPVEVDNRLDVEYKPGFYLQTEAFVSGDYHRFCTIEQQQAHVAGYYRAMSGYLD